MDTETVDKNGTRKYEICVVEEGRTIVFMSADTIAEAKKHRIRLREMYPDAAVEVFEHEEE